jgi:hypothetical protein
MTTFKGIKYGHNKNDNSNTIYFVVYTTLYTYYICFVVFSFITFVNKSVDIKFNAHDAFLE